MAVIVLFDYVMCTYLIVWSFVSLASKHMLFTLIIVFNSHGSLTDVDDISPSVNVGMHGFEQLDALHLSVGCTVL
jgi:hypothetical protein